MTIIKRLSKLLKFKNSQQEKRLRSIFFELIQGNNGAITVMEFAIKADITGQEARKYLDQYATEFEANFDTTEAGHVVYLFPVGNQSKDNQPDNSDESQQKNSNKIPIKEKNNSLEDDIQAKIDTLKAKNIVDVSAIEKDVAEIGKRVKEIGDSFKF